MAKKRHYTPQEINMQNIIQKAVDDEVRRRCEEGFFDYKTRKAVNATHKADIIFFLTIMIDTYGAESDHVRQIIEQYIELLNLYSKKKVQLTQMQNHIDVMTGIKIDDFIDLDIEKGVGNGEEDEA